MCGRFAQTAPLSEIMKVFIIDEAYVGFEPRYNISPGNSIPAIAVEKNQRILKEFTWGLIPSWSKDPKIACKMINARGETLTEKPSFRNAFKSRRCLIPATGFYEWKKEQSGKKPVYIYLKSQKPFGLAGLHETWTSPSGEKRHTSTIITTEPNELIRPIHNRMPVIIPETKHQDWLTGSTDTAQSLIVPYSSEDMDIHFVSNLVNSPTNDVPECIQPENYI